MKKELKMPSMKPGTRSAVLCAWLKEPGEAYEKGEALCEIETEKVVGQLEADGDGIMGTQFAQEGDEVSVGAVIAEVEG